MIITVDSYEESLGLEPKEVFGYSTDDELEEALQPLMQEIPCLTEVS